MTTPFWCLLVIVAMPYVLAGLTGYFKARQFGGIDNHHPRAQTALLEGPGARANAAQANAWEAVALFGTAVFMAHLAGADPAASSAAAVVYVVTRILHAGFYIADLPTARSGIFLVGVLCCVRLFYLAIAA